MSSVKYEKCRPVYFYIQHFSLKKYQRSAKWGTKMQETNPGPFVVDCEKTICAAYTQGNALVFNPEQTIWVKISTLQQTIATQMHIKDGTCSLKFSITQTIDIIKCLAWQLSDFQPSCLRAIKPVEF